MIVYRRAKTEDWDQIWPLLHSVFLAGDSYPFLPETSQDEAFQAWMEAPVATYVAVEDDLVLGTYYLKPNQIGLGNHICNAGYIVSDKARGKGLGRRLCAHSLVQAKELGFQAMQFNYVVSTNELAVALWKNMGFQIVGTVPRAFQHCDLGLVDVYVMYQSL